MPSDRPSLRGVGIGPLLEAQRAYARKFRSKKYGLVVPEAFVRGIRDLGYRGNSDAVAELIDNALQAYADRIDVLFGYDGTPSDKKPTQLVVSDNGHGMEPDMIRMAVMWGGTHRENDRGGLGRYGYGLPCSAVSLGRRFTVFSQVAGAAMYKVELDLDDIAAGKYTDQSGDIVVPPPERAELPPFVRDHLQSAFGGKWGAGTVVLIEKLDRLEWSTAGALGENFRRRFGVTYHKLRGEAALYVDGVFVEPVDPLFLTSDFSLHDLDEDRAQALDPVRIEVRDPATGKFLGAMTLRYAWLPPSFGSIDKERDAVGINANARFVVLKEYHGILFSRNGRLIDVQTRTPWTTFINNDRYIKVELEFSASLDEAFGVTTAKQQVTVTPAMWERLGEAGLPKAIEQLRGKVKAAKAERRSALLSPPAGKHRLSERAMTAASSIGSSRNINPQWELGLRVSPYRVEFEYGPGAAFFRIGRDRGARTLTLNTAHGFYHEVYAATTTAPETRAALEILLFTLGDVLLDNGSPDAKQGLFQLLSWSRRLERALGILSEHMADDGDVAPERSA